MAPVRFILSYVAFVLLWPWLRRNRKLSQGRAQRWGRYPPLAPHTGRPRIWWHGASAGDIIALLPTLRAVHAKNDQCDFVMTALTDSGHMVAAREAGALAQVHYAPWDLPHCVARALDALAPDVLVLEYAELWPNLIFAARARQVAVVLHNGRLSAHRVRGYRWLSRLAGNVFTPFSALLMRDAQQAARAVALGANAARVHVTGDTKFDHVAQRPSPGEVMRLARALSLPPGPLVWVAGSTHDGEEAHMFAAHQQICRALAVAPILIVAPRYIDRAQTLLALAERFALHAVRRSQLGAAAPKAGDVVILDTWGELFTAYALASVVFVGGSFVPRGGQNVLEPAAQGCPVLFGPFMHNFTEAAQLLAGHGGQQLDTPAQLAPVLLTWLRDAPLRRRLGDAARAQVRAQCGAAACNAAHILQAASGVSA